MTAQATSVVSIERHDNVIYLNFLPDPTPPGAGQDESAGWPWAEGPADADPGETPAATRPLPVRWSPRPVRVLRRRIGRSRCAADLRDLRNHPRLLGLLLAVLLVFEHDQLNALASTLTPGGTP